MNVLYSGLMWSYCCSALLPFLFPMRSNGASDYFPCVHRSKRNFVTLFRESSFNGCVGWYLFNVLACYIN